MGAKKATGVAQKAKAPKAPKDPKPMKVKGGAKLEAANTFADDEPKQKRPRLERRNSEDQADRVIDEKFGGQYDPVVLKNRKNSNGETLAEVVVAEVRRKKPKKEYFKADFWKKQFSDFDLSVGLFKDLPEITGAEEPNDDLIEAIANAQEKAIANRRTDRLESLLEHSPCLCQDDLVILIGESQETAVVTHDQSRMMYMLALQHIAKHKVFEKMPQLWSSIRDEMEHLLKEHATFLSVKKGIKRANIVKNLRVHLSAFVDSEAVVRIETALKDKKPPEGKDVCAVADTLVGAEIYKAHVGTMQYQQFIKRCDDRLATLEDNNYMEEEIDGFKTLMQQDLKGLVKFGFKVLNAKECVHTLLGRDTNVTVPGLADDYCWRFLARLETLTIGQGKGVRLPWETLLWGDAVLEDVPQTVHIPMEHIERNTNARETLISWMPENEQTIKQMIALTRKHESTLLDLAKDFAQECDFLYNHVTPLAEKQIADLILKPFPEKGATLVQHTPSSVLEILKTIKLTKLYRALDKTFTRQIETLELTLSKIIEGHGPCTLADFKGTFLKHFDLRISYFYVMTPGKAPSPCSAKKLWGAQAARQEYNLFSRAVLEAGSDWREYVPRLRTYAWLLTEAEQKHVEDVVKKAVRERTTALDVKALADAHAD